MWIFTNLVSKSISYHLIEYVDIYKLGVESISYHLIEYVDIYKLGVEIDIISFDRVCGYLQTWCRNRYHII